MTPTATLAGTVFTVLGYAVGALAFFSMARARGIATEGIGRVALAGFCGGILGARATEWGLVHWPLLAAHPAAFLNPSAGGRTIIGGILAGWASVEVAKRWLGIRRSTGDLFALALAAGEAVGRIGCFFNSDCYGTLSRVPWAVYQNGAWRHPTQLYSAAVAAVIFVLLFWLRDRMPREGDLFRLYLVLYGSGRFIVEEFRERTLGLGGLSLAQWVSLELAIMGIVALILSTRRPVRAEIRPALTGPG